MTSIACHECEKAQKIVGMCVRCGGFVCEQCARWCTECRRLLCDGCGAVHLTSCDDAADVPDHAYGYCGRDLCR